MGSQPRTCRSGGAGVSPGVADVGVADRVVALAVSTTGSYVSGWVPFFRPPVLTSVVVSAGNTHHFWHLDVSFMAALRPLPPFAWRCCVWVPFSGISLAHWTQTGRQQSKNSRPAFPAAVRVTALMHRNPWVLSTKLVVKPDQLIKRRGKAGLLMLNATWDDAKAWVNARVNTEVTVDGVRGLLNVFIVEAFCPHPSTDEYYICIQSHRFGEEVLFHHEVREWVPRSVAGCCRKRSVRKVSSG